MRIEDLHKLDDEFVRKMGTTTRYYLDISKEYLIGKCCGERIREKTMALFNDSRRGLSLPIRLKEDEVNGGTI